MAKFNCFSVLTVKKKKGTKLLPVNNKSTLLLKLQEQPIVSPKKESLNTTSFDVLIPFGIENKPTCEVKVLREISTAKTEVIEDAYEAGDEHDESLSMTRDLSDMDLQARVTYSGKDTDDPLISNIKSSPHNVENDTSWFEMIKSGHLSDPGIGKMEVWDSPRLKRSCSNLETGTSLEKIKNRLPSSMSHSYEDMQKLKCFKKGEVIQGIQTSPLSVITSCSADRIMLKRRSSSQVLPSRSKRIWWKFFLWSHRNLHKPSTPKPKLASVENSFSQKAGYASDTLEPGQALATKKNKGKEPLHSPGSCSFESANKYENNYDNQNWSNCHGGDSSFWHQNQWVAFSTEPSPLSRVDEWVRSLETEALLGQAADVFSPSPETSRAPARFSSTPLCSNVQVPEEVVQANNVIRSLNSFSTVAHVASMGLKVIPNMSPFFSLRSVNLSGNFIVHIGPGSLPKGLHTLNLSRNKISAIDGLRELTRLRILDLSYNKISRIGHGLSNCTVIKELYLAGNKISDIEGLHRLLKLTVLDLSFNKITTTKAFGQLIANYNSLMALNLVGNPIQGNLGDDQLRKAVSGLLPMLAFLNKQPLKPQRAREAITDTVARAALGNNDRNLRRKVSRHRLSSRSRTTEGSSHRSRPGSKGNNQPSPSARK